MSTSTETTADLEPPGADPRHGVRLGPLLVIFAVGSAVTVALGAYGRVHDPTGQAFNLTGFSSGLAAKSWLTTAAFALAVLQLITASALYGRIPWRGRWVAPVHRWSGRLAVLVTVPVAVHCLYALGFQTFSTRVLVHSILGCFFFGAFVAKMLVLTRDDAPPWTLPALGGAVFAALAALWATASVWYFATFGIGG